MQVKYFSVHLFAHHVAPQSTVPEFFDSDQNGLYNLDFVYSCNKGEILLYKNMIIL